MKKPARNNRGIAVALAALLLVLILGCTPAVVPEEPAPAVSPEPAPPPAQAPEMVTPSPEPSLPAVTEDEVPGSVVTENISMAAERVAPFIVQIIYGVSEDGWRSLTFTTAVGNGFLVNRDGYVLTDVRAIERGEEYAEDTGGKMRIVVPAHPGWGWSTQNPCNTSNDFEIIARDESHGLVLLRIDIQTPVVPGVGGRMNAIVYSTGVGSGLVIEPLPLEDSGNLTAEDIVAVSLYPVAQGELGHALKWGDLVTDTGGFSAPGIGIEPGGSGAPAYLAADGSIIGMCVHNEGYARIIPAGDIAAFLDANDIVWEEVVGES